MHSPNERTLRSVLVGLSQNHCKSILYAMEYVTGHMVLRVAEYFLFLSEEFTVINHIVMEHQNE